MVCEDAPAHHNGYNDIEWRREMPERIYFYCDESGAKGYADQQEKYPGEVGVFAGLLVPEQQHADLSIKLDMIAKRFTPEQGKLHIIAAAGAHTKFN